MNNGVSAPGGMGKCCVAVVVDGSATSRLAVERAAQIAGQRHGRLTLIATAPRPWWVVALAGFSTHQLHQEAIAHSESVLRQLAAEVPRDVPCLTVLLRGNPVRETERYLREHDHDVLVSGTARRGAMTRGARRRRAYPLVSAVDAGQAVSGA